MATETAPPAPAPQIPSRYRSVRRAPEQLQPPIEDQPPPPMPAMPPMPPVQPVQPVQPAADGPQVSRSMSRYHRRPGAANRGPPVRSATTIVPPLPAAAPVDISSARNRAVSSPSQPPQPSSSRYRTEGAPNVPQYGRERAQHAREEAKQLLQEEAERQRRMQERQRAERRAHQEAEEERARQEKARKEQEEAERARAQREAAEAEQLRRQREQQQREEQERGKRLHKAESAAHQQRREEEERKLRQRNHVTPPTSPPRFGGLFHRKRKDDAPMSPERHVEPVALVNKIPQASNERERDLENIRIGGGGAVLGIDAPISAVNAGDRQVLVVCNKKQIFLPVNPTTTPLDLIKSANTCLNEPFDPRTAALLESFHKVGVTRPLRNYEHVRDVMNAWDDDKQNELVLVDSRAEGINQDTLLALKVPDHKPSGMGCFIHYSTKPGKWSKRYVTLRDDGQLVLSKNETSKDFENICNLIDFDIYKPTERKLGKVKPPKKVCYAVKSQLRSNFYVDESRYVHFFCTNDRSTASLFYDSLHRWRSWHLKHVMGEGQKKPSAPAVPQVSQQAAQPASHTRGQSIDGHYQLGTFAPLLDLDSFGKEPKVEVSYKPGALPDDAPLAQLDTKAMYSRKMSMRGKGPPISYNMNGTNGGMVAQATNRQNSMTQSNKSDSEGEVFASGGLLGRTYTTKQRQMQEKEKDEKAFKPMNGNGAFTEGPSLLNNANYNAMPASNDTGLGRRSSVRSNHRRTSSDMGRSMSMRGKPKPLVDLTPQYKEPPQHARKGKAFVPGPGNAGPLVENATSIEEAIKVPSSQDWRSRPMAGRPGHNHTGGTYGNGNFERTRSLKNRGEGLANYTVNNHSGAPEDDNGFTGGGLLAARTGFSQGRTAVGHGVMDGSKARGPMLDLREGSQFASGSLLAGVERKQGPMNPVIDRDNSS